MEYLKYFELLELYSNETEKFIIFCRNKKNFFELMEEKKKLMIKTDKIEIYETDLYNLDENLKIVHNFKNEISGIFWIAGYTGDGIKEYGETHQAKRNIKINFLNPVIILSEISKKMIKNKTHLLLFLPLL